MVRNAARASLREVIQFGAHQRVRKQDVYQGQAEGIGGEGREPVPHEAPAAGRGTRRAILRRNRRRRWGPQFGRSVDGSGTPIATRDGRTRRRSCACFPVRVGCAMADRWVRARICAASRIIAAIPSPSGTARAPLPAVPRRPRAQDDARRVLAEAPRTLARQEAPRRENLTRWKCAGWATTGRPRWTRSPAHAASAPIVSSTPPSCRP